jgi:hypothetical protein
MSGVLVYCLPEYRSALEMRSRRGQHLEHIKPRWKPTMIILRDSKELFVCQCKLCEVALTSMPVEFGARATFCQTSAQKQLFVGIKNREFRANRISHLRPG